ncbi:outer membrane beta-barrel family protein [Chitinophaga solisilvae]|uniref:outer membrane beta-barrel family protein n=1 Tax=Chitinophaga solisilvae TaxID=1233460 RepID=UPI00136B64E5|nr:outer membrane beta-barrel family protein [Chitinophaga solisilvae]
MKIITRHNIFFTGRWLLLCLLLLTYFTAQAQQRIAGRVTDNQGEAVPFAGVLLLHLPDSQRVSTAISDTAGYFQLPAAAKGSYLLKVSSMEHLAYTGPQFTLPEGTALHQLPDVVLTRHQRMLQAVHISGGRPAVEQQMDKTVMRIENSVLAEGSTALELLAKMPGVTVDNSGNVSLKGRPGTLVMINGKPAYLTGNQLANLLRGTASGNISRIEIMTNPSARYDASGKGGIVNIVMKKSTKDDFNGTVSVNGGAGRGARGGGNVSTNYSTGKLNVFGSYNYIFEDLKNDYITLREFENHTFRREQTNNETARLRAHDFRAGADVTINARNTIGLQVSGNAGKYPVVQQTQNLLTGLTDHTRLQDARTATTGKENWLDLLYNVSYLHRFNDKGHEVTVDADYVSHYSRMKQQLDTRYHAQDGTPLPAAGSRKGDIPSENNIYVLKTDYALPLGKAGKLEAGWKGSYVKTENNLQYDTLHNHAYEPDHSASNHFIYQEHIQAGYVNLKQTYGKFSIQAGLRGEYTHTRGHQITTDSVATRSYFKLFPSIFLSREFNDHHKLQLSYSRRIERPGYWDLNPFRLYADPFNYEEGNPYLLPAIANTAEMSYTFRSVYHATLTYSRSTDVISNLVGAAQDHTVMYTRPENLASFTNYGLSITAATDFTRWWKGSQFINLFHNTFSAGAAGKQVFKGGSFTFDSQNTFTISSRWKAELNALFRTSEVSGVFTTKSYYMISAGAQREVLKGKGTIKLLVNDIFRSRRIKEYSLYNNIYTYNDNRFDSRSCMLSFSYRFGSGTQDKGRRSTGSEELKGRLK